MDKDVMTFETFFRCNELRFHYNFYHIAMNSEQDCHEGLVVMWKPDRIYLPDKGPMATYFNYVIRMRLIDLTRERNREHIHV